MDEFPYSTAGTVFLVGYAGKPFILTSRHGLLPETPQPICVFPSDYSHRLIPLDDVFFVPSTDEPEDFMDLAVVAIDTSRITHAEVANAHLIALTSDLVGWPEHASELFLIGYPKDHSFVDPESGMLHTQRVVLNGRYVGKSSLPYLHTAKITDAHSLSTFNGFSGGPVFSVLRFPGEPPTAGLCGMAIRGASSSNIIHFLDRTVLIDALNIRLERQNLSR
ncbi:cupin domain-containing protein [Sideroxyarcus sp. TK5]